MPKDGAPSDAVCQLLRDELDLDGRPNLNLARYACSGILDLDAVRLRSWTLATVSKIETSS